MVKLQLDKNVVFILGAGASQPYGFPLGNELKSRIVNRLQGFNGGEILKSHFFQKELIEQFIEALQYSYLPTIDIFLEKKAQYRDIGAYAIALTLLPCEEIHNLFPHKNWYAILYNFLGFEDPVSIIPKASIVTLNYDRSLEHFLTKSIEYNYPHNEIERARSILRDIQIVHAHGSIGNYPEIPYGEKIEDMGILKRAAKGIKITSDHLDDSSEFKLAQQIIAQGEQIVFLGFGFEPRTLQLLFNNADISKKKIFSSDFKLSQERRDIALNFFNKNINFSANYHDAENFLKKYLLSNS